MDKKKNTSPVRELCGDTRICNNWSSIQKYHYTVFGGLAPVLSHAKFIRKYAGLRGAQCAYTTRKILKFRACRSNLDSKLTAKRIIISQLNAYTKRHLANTYFTAKKKKWTSTRYEQNKRDSIMFPWVQLWNLDFPAINEKPAYGTRRWNDFLHSNVKLAELHFHNVTVGKRKVSTTSTLVLYNAIFLQSRLFFL